MDLKSILILHITIILPFICGIQEKSKYEPINDICLKCSCSSFNDSLLPGYSILDCTNKNFNHLLVGWPEYLGKNHSGKEIVFIFSGNPIQTLQQLPASEASVFFSCRHCSIKEIEIEAFIDIPNIIRVDLSWNKLTKDSLTADVFRGRYDNVKYEPIGLEDLDLSNNLIMSFGTKTFEHMPYLKRLSIANNPINQIDEGTTMAFSKLTSIEHLDMSNINILTIPDRFFTEMRFLRELLIQGNNLKTVPETLPTSLVSLYLGNNPIEELNDESFIGLHNLTHLNISSMSSLVAIKEGTFTELRSLEVLVCRNNSNLTEFDLSSLKGLTKLRELDISYNNLKKLTIDDLTDIKEDYDKDDSVPVEIIEFPRLRSLRLEGNPWHCNCYLYAALSLLKHHGTDDFQTEDEPRCFTPYEYTSAKFSDLKQANVCANRPKKTPKIPIYEPPVYLRPRNIVLSVLTVTVVVFIGIAVGIIVVCIKKRLKKHDLNFGSPVRYTTVRNSTSSAAPLQT